MTDFQGFGISSMATKPVIWDAEHADHRRAFATAIAPIVSVLWKRKEPFGRPEAMTYMRTLKYIPSAILVEAVERLLASEQWFPEPAKMLDVAASIVSERRALAAAPLKHCPHASQWVDGAHGLERCACWRAARAAMAAIGEPMTRRRITQESETSE